MLSIRKKSKLAIAHLNEKMKFGTATPREGAPRIKRVDAANQNLVPTKSSVDRSSVFTPPQIQRWDRDVAD